MESLIEKCQTSDEYHTHVSMDHPKGKLVFDRPVVDTFWSTYSNFVYEEKEVHIAEKFQSIFPVLVDIDIKKEGNHKHLYTNTDVEEVVKIYQDVLKQIIQNCTPEHLICFVLEKPSYMVEKDGVEYTKNGYHLHFINTFLAKNDHINQLLPRVKKSKYGDMIDECVTRNPWLMYGSSKSAGLFPYKLTHIYNDKLEKISLEDATKNYELYDTNENLIEMSNPMFLLPRILSVIPWHRKASTLLPNLQSIIKKEVSYSEEDEDEEENEDKQNERQEKIKLGLQHVKKERFKDYLTWIQLCQMMVKNKLPRHLFIKYSKESGYTPFDEEGCNKKWYQVVEKKVKGACGFPTLKKWLEEDGINWKPLLDKKEEDKISKKIFDDIEKFGALNTKIIVDVFAEEYKDDLYYLGEGKWLQYKEKKGWIFGEPDEIIYPIMKSYCSPLNDYYSQMMEKITKKIEKSTDSSVKDLLIAEHKRLNKYRVATNQKIGDHSFCIKVVKASHDLFKNENILNEFDLRPDWFCFSDQKAIDLFTGNVIDIKKTDKILTTCGYPLPKRIEADMKRAEDFILQIQPRKNLESFMSGVAIDLYGRNRDQIFIQHKGNGANSKSLFANVKRKVYGNYAMTFPIEQMTEKATGRDSANSALVQSRGKRYLQSNEPETDDKENMTLKASCVKSLTGSENIRVRELYGKSVEFPPNFTPHILLNGTIKINDTGYAMQRRIKVIFYPITFVDKNMLEYERQSYNNRQEEIKEELETLQGDLSDKQLLNKQFLLDELKKPFLFSLKDPSLEDKLINDKSFLNGFLYYMMDWFRKTNGTFISNEENNKATEDYFNENNPLNDWVKGYTAIDPKKPENKSKFIRSQVLHKEFVGNFMIEMGIKKFNENLKNFKHITCVDDTSNGMKVWLVKKKADDVE